MTIYSQEQPSLPINQTIESYKFATPMQGRLAAARQGFADTFFLTGIEYGAAKLADAEVFDVGRHLTQQEANDRVKAKGLDFKVPETGMNSRALKIMLDRQHSRKRRQQTIEASGIGGFSQFSSTLLGSLPDPFNLIAWPLAPEAAAMRGAVLATRVSSRLARGGMQGVSAAAALEVAYIPMARGLGDDYTMFDSVMNITMGGIFGGGFHVVGRGISDIRNPYQAPAPEVHGTHPEVEKVALFQAMTGQDVEIDGVLLHVADEFDVRIRRALDEGDRVEARRLSEEKARVVPAHPDVKIAPRGSPADLQRVAAGEPRSGNTDVDAQVAASERLAAHEKEGGGPPTEEERGKAEEVRTLDEEGEETIDILGPEAKAAKDAADAEVEALLEAIDGADEELTAVLEKGIREADEEIEEASTFARAFKSAAACHVRKGSL